MTSTVYGASCGLHSPASSSAQLSTVRSWLALRRYFATYFVQRTWKLVQASLSPQQTHAPRPWPRSCMYVEQLGRESWDKTAAETKLFRLYLLYELL